MNTHYICWTCLTKEFVDSTEIREDTKPPFVSQAICCCWCGAEDTTYPYATSSDNVSHCFHPVTPELPKESERSIVQFTQADAESIMERPITDIEYNTLIKAAEQGLAQEFAELVLTVLEDQSGAS